MPKPTAEQLKKWYASFAAKASSVGIDLNTVAGRMAVRGVYVCPDEAENDTSADYFAFAPGNSEGEYDTDIPYPANFVELYANYRYIVTVSNTVAEDSANLINNSQGSGYSKAKLDLLNKIDREIKEFTEDSAKSFDDNEEAYLAYDKWLVNNLKPVDPETANGMAVIEKLYNLASVGKLFFIPGTVKPDAAVQLYVNKDGECGMTKGYEDYPLPSSQNILVDTGDPVVFSNIDTERYIDDPEIRDRYLKLTGTEISISSSAEAIKLFRENVFEKTYRDLPAGNRSDMADSFAVSNLVMTSSRYMTNVNNKGDRSLSEAEHLRNIIERSRKYPNYLETVVSDPEKGQQLRAEFKKESEAKIKADTYAMTEKIKESSEKIRKAEAEEIAQLKKWYLSFADEVKKLGGDLTNPADMLNVNIFFETFNREAPVTDRFAFVPMDDRGRYTDPEPQLDAAAFEDLTKRLSESSRLGEKAVTEYNKAAELISKNQIDEAREASAMGDYYSDKMSQTMTSHLAEQASLQSKHDAWLIRNLRPVDPDNPADIDRIRIMYLQASKGLLSYGQGVAPEDIRQVTVTSNGSCSIGIAIRDTPANEDVTWEQLINDDNVIFSGTGLRSIFAKNPEIRARYEETFHETIIDPVPVPEPPADLVRPEQPPRPGFVSALKWFFSFGQNTSDYDAYNSYPERLERYNAAREEFLQRERDAARINGNEKKQWDKVIRNIGARRHADNPEKAALYDNNFYRMFEHKTQIGGQTTQPASTLLMSREHIRKLWLAAKDDPEVLSEKNIDENGNYIVPESFNRINAESVNRAADKVAANFTRKSFKAQITQELSRMNLGLNMEEVSDNLQLLALRIEQIMAPCAIPAAELMNSEQLVDSVELGNLGDLKTLGADSGLANAISAFAVPGDYENGLATLTGILSLADTDNFAALIDYTLLAGKSPNRLNEKYPEQMSHLRNVAKELVFNPDGTVNADKYAEALSTAISRCTSRIFKKDGQGLNAERVAMCSLASRLADKLGELGRSDLIPADTRDNLEIAKQIPFVVNVSTATTPAMAPFADAHYLSDERRRENASELIGIYSKALGTIMLHGALDEAFKTNDFRNLSLVRDVPTMLATMRGFAKKIKETADPLDFTNIHDADVRNRLASNALSGKAFNGKSLDADEPAVFSQPVL